MISRPLTDDLLLELYDNMRSKYPITKFEWFKWWNNGLGPSLKELKKLACLDEEFQGEIEGSFIYYMDNSLTNHPTILFKLRNMRSHADCKYFALYKEFSTNEIMCHSIPEMSLNHLLNSLNYHGEHRK